MKKSRLKYWPMVAVVAGSGLVIGALLGIFIRGRVANKAYVETSPVTIHRNLAQAKSRKMVLLFYRPGCRYCQQIKGRVNRDEARMKVGSPKTTALFLKVRTTNPANIRVLDRYQVAATPTFMVIKNGQIMTQYTGTQPTKIDHLMLGSEAK